jgi:hypothetical protein
VLPGIAFQWHGIPIARTTVQTVTKSEQASDKFKSKLQALDEQINIRFVNFNSQDITEFKLFKEDEEPDEDNLEQELLEPNATSIPVDEIEPDSYDKLFLAEPRLMKDGQLTKARIIDRKRDRDNNLIGQYNANPILNTRIHLAEFPDGHIQE